MKKKTDPRRLAADVVDRVFRTQGYADLCIDTVFKRNPLPKRDRALVTELVHGTLRWLGRIDWILETLYRGRWSKVPPEIRRILEVALYQILFLDHVPSYAAVFEAVQSAKEVKGGGWASLVNALLREAIRSKDILDYPSMESDPVQAISVKWSHPQWLVERWISLWGPTRTMSLCRANNERPSVGIRVNRMKNKPQNILNELKKQGIPVRPSLLLDEFLMTDKSQDVLSSHFFANGDISIQDVSAGLVAHLADPKPGDVIWDVSAAPGGKSTHMAELARDRLTVIATDLHRSRLCKVASNTERLNLNSVSPVNADSTRMRLKHPVDIILVDAPCSGFGVIRRRSELRWLRQPEQIPPLISIQDSLLSAASAMVKNGGILVYSTCTVLPEENTDVVDRFLKKHPEFRVEDARAFVPETVVSNRGFIQTWPDVHGIDGSFAARFRKVR